jgi:hypothetical protein
MEASTIKLVENNHVSRICSGCHVEKPISDFYEYKGVYKGTCKECYTAHYRGKDRTMEKKRYQLRTMYGITWEDFLSVLQYQNYSCAICKRELKPVGNNSEKNSVGCVDHDHTSGKLRGILCSDCNTGLGSFKEDVESLKQAVRYLEIHRI